MPIDSSIIGRLQPVQLPQQDPNQGLNALARVMQIQGAQSQNALAQYGLSKARRDDEDQIAIRSELSAPGADPYKVLLQRGKVKEATDYQKAQADAEKNRIDNERLKVDTAHKRVDSWGQAMGWLRQNPTPENAAAAVQHLVTLGVMPAEMAQAALSSVQTNPTPQSIAQFADMGFRTALQAKDQLPKFESRNLGGSTQMTAADPVTGQVRVVNSVANTQSPDNKATVGASYANAAATREVAKATRDAAQITGNQNTEMKLGDDYRAQSKNFKETADAYKQISAVLDKATTSPAATLAGATKFMKMIDPGSVVRESELGMALAATGVFDRATNYFNRLQSGNVLTASQVADFKAITKQINDAASQQQKLIDNHYSTVAKNYGLRPEMVVQDFGQGGAAPAAGGAGGVPADIAAILAKHGGGRKGQ